MPKPKKKSHVKDKQRKQRAPERQHQGATESGRPIKNFLQPQSTPEERAQGRMDWEGGSQPIRPPKESKRLKGRK